MLFQEAAFTASKTGVAFAHPSAKSRIFIFVEGRPITPSFDPLLSIMGPDAPILSSDHVDTIVSNPEGQFDLLVGSHEFINDLIDDWGWFILTEEQLEDFRTGGDWDG